MLNYELPKPPMGMEGTLYRKLDVITETGEHIRWVRAAEVKADGDNPGSIYFTVLEEGDDIVVKGKKIDLFRRRVKMMFVWEPGSAEFDLRNEKTQK